MPLERLFTAWVVIFEAEAFGLCWFAWSRGLAEFAKKVAALYFF
jgi:hypothetical protein